MRSRSANRSAPLLVNDESRLEEARGADPERLYTGRTSRPFAEPLIVERIAASASTGSPGVTSHRAKVVME